MAGDGRPRPVFELYDAAPAGPEQDVLGLWTPVPLVEGGALAFEVPGGLEDAAPVWRANYSADPELMEADLEEARKQLEVAEAALILAPARLDAYLAQGQAGLAYDLPATGSQPSLPEEDLTLLLGEIQGVVPVTSYALDDSPGGRWDHAFEAFQAFADRFQQVVGHLAWVETEMGGRLVGRTAVTWTGDMETMLLEWFEPDQLRLHQQTLSLALASRRTVLRTSSLVIANAVKLSALLATPGGIALAIPAVLRFIYQLRKELTAKEKIEKEV
jgi:hypothetical protein